MVCGGSDECVDCTGEPNGRHIVDPHCDGPAEADDLNRQPLCVLPSEACVADCNGSWGGVAEFDACRICGGGSTTGDGCKRVSAAVSLPQKTDGSQYACSEVVRLFADALAGGDASKISGIDATTGLCTEARRRRRTQRAEDHPRASESARRQLQLMVEFPFVVAIATDATTPTAQVLMDSVSASSGLNATASEPELLAIDCFGQVGGAAAIDVCGICGGDGTACLDCAGVPFGSRTVDPHCPGPLWQLWLLGEPLYPGL